MTPREIIAAAWAITQKEKVLRRWGYFSSIFETLLNVKLVSYQVYFFTQLFKGESAGFFDVEIHIYNALPHWFFWTFIIFLTTLIVVELFVPHLARGAIIGLAAKSYHNEKPEGGLVLALYNFFPIFAIDEIFVLGSLGTTVTLISVVIRYIGGDIQWPIIVLIIFFWLFCSLLRFLASFAPPAVVVNKMNPFAAIGLSFKLLLSHLGQILFLVLLLVIISIRVAINAVAVLLIPGIVVGIAYLFGFFDFSPAVSYSIAGGIGIVLVAIVSYFFAYLHVFREAVWTVAYIELMKKKDVTDIGS